MNNILLLEDDQRIASLVSRAFAEEGYSVKLAYDGAIAQKLIQQYEFDILIMDVIVPQINGLDVCKWAKERYPALPIIILTALGTTDDKIEGFDAGAEDYLVKPFDIRELVVRVRSLLKRHSLGGQTAASLLRYHDLEMNTNTKKVFRQEQEINLTPKEFKLLEFMLRNTERVLARSEIAEQVWDTHFDTGTNFIDVYINYLRKKIDKEFPEKLIHTKSGMGFILEKR